MKTCTFCGETEPADPSPFQQFELHHLAGFANHPFWAVTVCPDDHHVFSAWQYSQRIPLRGKNTKGGVGKHIPKDWGDREIPSAVRFQAVIHGLEQAYAMTMLRAGSEDTHREVKHLIRWVTRFNPDMMKGSTFSEEAYFARMKAKNPVPLGRMNSHNVQRVNAAIFGILAYLIEETLGVDHMLSIRLRALELRPPMVLSDMPLPDESDILTGCVESILGEMCMAGLNRHQRRAAVAIIKRRDNA